MVASPEKSCHPTLRVQIGVFVECDGEVKVAILIEVDHHLELARGDNDDGHDWVLVNGAVIAEKGAPIVLGSTEVFDDAAFAVGFFAFARNNAGDTLVAGTTSAGEEQANAVLTLNNSQVIAREHDPIDLDGD